MVQPAPLVTLPMRMLVGGLKGFCCSVKMSRYPRHSPSSQFKGRAFTAGRLPPPPGLNFRHGCQCALEQARSDIDGNHDNEEEEYEDEDEE